MGITYKAMDTHLGCPVALKVIHTRRFTESAARARLLREARTAAQLRHPNIASIFHLGLNDDQCFYAMEFIDGETLEERVHRTGPLPCKIALQIVAQIAHALQQAHAKNFIHRDIKPTNVMLTRAGTSEETMAKLIDFGLVKAVSDCQEPDEHVVTGYFAGTPIYASPEQLELGVVSATSDLYSLGLCLRYMLTGRLDEPAFNPTDRAAGRRCPPAATGTAGMPASVAALVSAMTQAAPARRPPTAAVVLDEVQRCLQAIAPRRWTAGLPWLRWSLLLVTLTAALLFFAARQSGRSLEPVGSGTVAAKANRLKKARLCYLQGEEALRKNTDAASQKAVELFSTAVATEPEDAEAYAALGNAYFQRVVRFNGPAEQLDRALDNVERAVAINPNSARAFTVLGAIRSWQGRHWEALTQLHRALEIDPANTRTMLDFGLLWCCVGQPQFALPWARAAAKKDPSNPWTWIALSDACTDLCDDAQAEASYRRCLEINPGFVEARCGLMHLHLLRGEFARADQEYRVIESIYEPELIHPATLKAQAEFFRGDYPDAEESYRRLLAKNRQGAVDYYSGISYLSALGTLCLRMGKVEEGRALLQEAAGMHVGGAEGPQSIYDLAATRCVQGRRNDALSLLRQAFAAGWTDHRATRLDPRFDSLRGDSGFLALVDALAARVGRLRQQAEALCARPLTVTDYPVRPPPDQGNFPVE